MKYLCLLPIAALSVFDLSCRSTSRREPGPEITPTPAPTSTDSTGVPVMGLPSLPPIEADEVTTPPAPPQKDTEVTVVKDPPQINAAPAPLSYKILKTGVSGKAKLNVCLSSDCKDTYGVIQYHARTDGEGHIVLRENDKFFVNIDYQTVGEERPLHIGGGFEFKINNPGPETDCLFGRTEPLFLGMFRTINDPKAQDSTHIEVPTKGGCSVRSAKKFEGEAIYSPSNRIDAGLHSSVKIPFKLKLISNDLGSDIFVTTGMDADRNITDIKVKNRSDHSLLPFEYFVYLSCPTAKGRESHNLVMELPEREIEAKSGDLITLETLAAGKTKTVKVVPNSVQRKQELEKFFVKCESDRVKIDGIIVWEANYFERMYSHRHVIDEAKPVFLKR